MSTRQSLNSCSVTARTPRTSPGSHRACAKYATFSKSHGIQLSPHNLVIWLAIETGLVGTVLYAAFLIGTGVIYRRAARERRFSDAGKVGAVGLAALVAYQVQGMFTLSPNNPGHGLYFMIFVGATLRACMTSQGLAGPRGRLELCGIGSVTIRRSLPVAPSSWRCFKSAFRLLAIHDLSLDSYGRGPAPERLQWRRCIRQLWHPGSRSDDLLRDRTV